MMDLTYEFYINGTPEQIWDVLISPTGTKQVYYGSELRSTFEIGSPMEYVGPGVAGDETQHVSGTILEFEPNRVFSHTYKAGTAYGAEHANFESRLTYRLEPVGACTKLTLIHDRWAEGDPAYENTAKGLWVLLSTIKTLVETGKTLNLSSH